MRETGVNKLSLLIQKFWRIIISVGRSSDGKFLDPISKGLSYPILKIHAASSSETLASSSSSSSSSSSAALQPGVGFDLYKVIPLLSISNQLLPVIYVS
jgi:hypothetical protein